MTRITVGAKWGIFFTRALYENKIPVYLYEQNYDEASFSIRESDYRRAAEIMEEARKEYLK